MVDDGRNGRHVALAIADALSPGPDAAAGVAALRVLVAAPPLRGQGVRRTAADDATVLFRDWHGGPPRQREPSEGADR